MCHFRSPLSGPPKPKSGARRGASAWLPDFSIYQSGQRAARHERRRRPTAGRGVSTEPRGRRGGEFATQLFQCKASRTTTPIDRTATPARSDRHNGQARADSALHKTQSASGTMATPLLVQMLPEISNADEAAQYDAMRDLLAVARGYATGVRANGATAGTALWTELLARDAQSRRTLPRTWGSMHSTANRHTRNQYADHRSAPSVTRQVTERCATNGSISGAANSRRARTHTRTGRLNGAACGCAYKKSRKTPKTKKKCCTKQSTESKTRAPARTA